MTESSARGLGDNSGAVATICVTLKMFNSLAPYAGGSGPRRLEIPAGAVIGDLVERFQVPAQDIFLVLLNGKDVTRGMIGDPVNLARALDDGDEVALSGPVPYSWGFGAPIV